MKQFKGNRLTVTDEHLTLLKQMCVGWNDCEYGAPEVDPKRPYGDSDVALDIHEMLGWPTPEDGELDDDQERAAWGIHVEMEVVVALALHHPGEDVRGDWVNAKGYGDWERPT